ncbi:discoidin domain-containing protein [Hymenobacter sp. ASUV-10]|uniref:Discoidin domain-containing protein n=1 Tax=Hymenobacter aranciens TaxID=3063996 RepID=A0ABT9BDV9_9BACT|nr:discoidin domain-containing protein [Hymenobacter sp. ASUV-10]MDO7876454.1 discoidin domain-containing protein [Hymenobacter sp. ASUV-10]
MKSLFLFAWLLAACLLASKPGQAQNLALGKTTSASSNNQPSANAVDANGNTRWESASSDPQWLAVDLGSVQTIDRVRLTWENAYGRDFTIQVSTNGTSWTTVATTTNNATTVNEYPNLSTTGRYVRMYGTARATSYGYSLYEVEVFNYTNSPGSNLALNKTGAASTTQGGFPVAQAFDGNTATRWGSNSADNQWIYVDLGASANVTQVTLVWETAYGKDFHIDLSSNGTSWTTANTVTNNSLRFNDLAVTGAARYIRMYGVTRGTGYGFSLYEMRVYGTFPTPLPVTLTSFAATATSQVVNLKWATASEKNNLGFEVQRSADGREFTALGTVAGAGTSATPRSYGYRDAAPLAGTSYYRLQQTDLDGSVSYSPIAAVKIIAPTTITACEVFPNPATDRVTVTCNAAPTAWALINSNGQVVSTGTLSEMASASSFTFDLSSCQAGVYMLNLLSNGQPVQRARVVKAL